MAVQPRTGLTYEDLLTLPKDNFRYELIDGELIVTAAPGGAHQDVVLRLGASLLAYTDQNGGKVYVAPRDVYFSKTSVVEPDVIFVRAENLDRVDERVVRGAPDVVVEVSSPSTKRLELVRKRDLYERFGVSEYWYVDLDTREVYVDRLVEKRYTTRTYKTGDILESPEIPGFSIPVDDLLPPPSDD